jgi:hypothetical protein
VDPFPEAVVRVSQPTDALAVQGQALVTVTVPPAAWLGYNPDVGFRLMAPPAPAPCVTAKVADNWGVTPVETKVKWPSRLPQLVLGA